MNSKLYVTHYSRPIEVTPASKFFAAVHAGGWRERETSLRWKEQINSGCIFNWH